MTRLTTRAIRRTVARTGRIAFAPRPLAAPWSGARRGLRRVALFTCALSLVCASAPATAGSVASTDAAARSDAGAPVASSAVASAPPLRHLVFLDDGERVSSDPAHPLPASPWRGDVELFGLGDEVVAFQVVLDVGATKVTDASVSVTPWRDGENQLDARVDRYAEVFVDIQRATGNDRDPDDTLAFTHEAAPPATGPRSFVGRFADPLVPSAPVHVEPGARGAFWLDVHIPQHARAGTYHAQLTVRAGADIVGTRPISLRVIAHDLPYPGAAITAFYEPDTLRKRMGLKGDAGADESEVEVSLRRVLHAHHVSAIHEITSPTLGRVDEEALTGALYQASRGYVGPGEGAGEGILALGAYGALGAPTPEKVRVVSAVAQRLRALGVFDRTQTFVYAADEACESPMPGAWVDALAQVPEARGVRVGATCDHDPTSQRADLVLSTPEGYEPGRAARARAKGKWTWAYNGRRPFGAPMMLDLPATDLRANAWIAARYDIARWFYWESTFWLDNNRGGRGGADGFDPFVVAETFHNKDGDHADGDGILVYPGTQRVAGMRDYGRAEVFPSIRLKNLRRGAEDAAYIAWARATNRAAADRIVEGMVPRALAGATGRASWPESGVAWTQARRALLEVALGHPPPVGSPAPAPPAKRSGGCLGCTQAAGAPWPPPRLMWGALLVLCVAGLKARRRRPF